MGMCSRSTSLIVSLLVILSSVAPMAIAGDGDGDENSLGPIDQWDVRGVRAGEELPIGTRPFKIGVGPHPRNFPTPNWTEMMEGYEMAGRWGEVTNYWDLVPWYEEEEKLVDNATTAATIQALYTDNGMVPVFQTNVWNILDRPGHGLGAWLEVPPDMDPDTNMSDPGFRTRWVDHVRNISAEWQPEYYCLGNEVNSYHGWDPENAVDFQDNLPSLMAESYTAIKEVSPDTKVVLTFRLLELYHYDNLDLLELFDDTMVDIIAFTSYPSRTGDYDTPADLPDDYYYRIVEHTGLIPLAIAELGWTTHAAFGGDEDEQAEFLLWFLEHTQDIPWEYVQWLELHDLRAEGASTTHAQSVGLRRNDGTPKPVWDLWTALYNTTYTGDWDLVPRSPIWIVGDENFTIANGVSTGSGTEMDPYIIEGWEINGTVQGHCIRVENTMAHFIIRDCDLHSKKTIYGPVGLYLINVTNGHIIHNDIHRSQTGIALAMDSHDNTIHHNAFFDNRNHATDYGSNTVFWDDGTGEGNLWDDYHTRNVPPAEHDGITWDVPYAIGGPLYGGASDLHPLVHRPGHVPVVLEDSSAAQAFTGGPFRLTVFSPEERMFALASVMYWIDGSVTTEELVMMESAWGSMWGLEVDVPMDAMGPLGYLYVMRGPDGNLSFSNVSSAPVVDDDPPSVTSDATPYSVEVGETIDFDMDATDNIGVTEAWVEYWYGEGDPTNVSMTNVEDDRWHVLVDAATEPGRLSYVFHVADAAGNWNGSDEGFVDVVDSFIPWFGEDRTPSFVSTGDQIVFEVDVFDDVGVYNVTLQISVFDFYFENNTMDVSGSTYSYVINPDELFIGTLTYTFLAQDVNGNVNSTQERSLIIEDTEPPTFDLVTVLPAQVGTGEQYTVIVDAEDNYGIWKVEIVMTADPDDFNTYTRVYTILNGLKGYSGVVNIPTTDLGAIMYWVTVVDLNGNNVTSATMTTQIVDVTPPEVEPISPFFVDPGEKFEVTVVATDNIEVTGYTWEGLPFKTEGATIKGSIDEEGTHVVRVIVTDAAGNEAVAEFEVLVLSEGGLSTGSIILAVVLVLVVVAILVMLILRKGRREPPTEQHLGPADEGLKETPP